MKIIKILVENIREELEGAENYAKLFAQFKDSDRALSEVFARLSETELTHVNMLHEQAIRAIKEQKATGAETPTAMQAVWDWEHEKMVDTVAKIKALLSTK